MRRTLFAFLAVTGVAVALMAALPSLRGGAQTPPSSSSSPTAPAAGTAFATFGSGCFWCTESDFDKIDGVLETISGYMGGTTKNPTYKEVSRGNTGHAEVVRIVYDPAKVTYQALLDHYWRTTDVVDGGGQFCDRGSVYRPEIFVHSAEQRALAEAGKAALDKSGKLPAPVAVKITDASTFTRAEEYHQDFYKKNPGHYFRYRLGCGREYRLEELWGKSGRS